MSVPQKLELFIQILGNTVLHFDHRNVLQNMYYHLFTKIHRSLSIVPTFLKIFIISKEIYKWNI